MACRTLAPQLGLRRESLAFEGRFLTSGSPGKSPLSCFKTKEVFKKKKFYLFLAVLGLHCCAGFYVVASGGGSSLVVTHGFLSWWSRWSRALGFSRWSTWAQLALGTWHLPKPGIKPCLLHRQADSLPLSHVGSCCVWTLWRQRFWRVWGLL